MIIGVFCIYKLSIIRDASYDNFPIPQRQFKLIPIFNTAYAALGDKFSRKLATALSQVSLVSSKLKV